MKAITKLFNVDKKIFLFLTIISIIGILTGAFYMIILTSQDKMIIKDSLSNYLSCINDINLMDNFKNDLIINISYAVIIWLLGISIICLPIVIILIFMKSFIISFSFTSFIFNYKAKGILYALLYNFPHNIINLLIYLYLGTYSLKLSISLLKSIISKKNINLRNIMSKYLKILFISLFIIILTTVFEAVMVPKTFKFVINMI